MLNLKLNGENKVLVKALSLEDAIVEWALPKQAFAVAINEQFIPKSEYASTYLQEDDRVELLIPMQGG